MWGAFYGHGAAGIIVGRINLGIREAEAFEQVEVGCEVLLWFVTEALQALLAEVVHIEHKAYLEGALYRSIELFELLGNKALFAQALMVDEGRAAECAVALGILH